MTPWFEGLSKSLAEFSGDLALARRVLRQATRILFVGNGGSASIASHMAVDYTKNSGIEALCFNDLAALTCVANDYGYDMVFAKQIDWHARRYDVLVAISSSGRSLNILNAVNAARQKQCSVITLSGFDEGNPLRRMGDANFYVPSQDYGHVEISHLAILHSMVALDQIVPVATLADGRPVRYGANFQITTSTYSG